MTNRKYIVLILRGYFHSCTMVSEGCVVFDRVLLTLHGNYNSKIQKNFKFICFEICHKRETATPDLTWRDRYSADQIYVSRWFS